MHPSAVIAFVEADAISPQFFEKPYFLVPGKKAEKGYVLLRETLRKTKRVGIGRVVIRTREYLCAVIPQGDALVLNLLRYAQELVDPADYAFPSKDIGAYRISKNELAMAEQLIESMAGKWSPGDFKDEFRARLSKVIEKRMKSKGVVKALDESDKTPADAATNVVDFMALLQKSVASNKRTPAKKRVEEVTRPTARTKAAAKKPAKPAAKKAAKRVVAKAKPARKSA